MTEESDKTPEVRVSATEASRSFSSLLDAVEAGGRFLVQRHGRDVCLMVPPALDSRRASACLALLRAREPVLLDDAFERDLLDVVATERIAERPAWDS